MCDYRNVLILLLIFSITNGRYQICFLPLYGLLFILIAWVMIYSDYCD